ncbi:protein kinase domain-containing protein [Theileria equi strain WA]|uniref:Protein kinase domain-containing protein n=1 Tax=Theileria equi strain WA TaxID=1537102 RepID=L0B1E9_THEEQ|nr:protein kinase domain-containing protein [Theileria equi strain WA]AFZ80929.1 protein kinase domain-containing protein [Theileria equi strain WA]|eukprot:XP_004830595.1 protein kinase domain-containing protein [Theileria equi strain WA]
MTNCDEIVLYKNDKAVVLYNKEGSIKALPLHSVDYKSFENTYEFCPLCGSVLSDNHYTFMAQTYFYLLQRNHQRWSYDNDYSRDGDTPNESIFSRVESLSPIHDTSVTTPRESVESELRSMELLEQGSFFDARMESLDTGRFEQVPYRELSDSQSPTFGIPRELLVTGYYKRFFVERKKLGSGSFGHVYYCIHVMDNLVLGDYAVKKVAVGDDRCWLRRVIKEVKVREYLRHPNIVDYKHSWLELYRLAEIGPMVPWLFILMEYCNGGDLQTLIDNSDIHLSDNEVYALLYDIISGLHHLHSNCVLYRDLKAQNVLLNYTRSEFRAVLSDFGTCEFLNTDMQNALAGNVHTDSTGYYQDRGYTGTIEYTAPELFCPNRCNEYYKSDMWSLGIILYYISYGRLPYEHIDPKECKKMIIDHNKLKLPEHPARSPYIKMLIYILTEKDPNLRPDCESIINDVNMQRIFDERSIIEGGRQSLIRRFYNST